MEYFIPRSSTAMRSPGPSCTVGSSQVTRSTRLRSSYSGAARQVSRSASASMGSEEVFRAALTTPPSRMRSVRARVSSSAMPGMFSSRRYSSSVRRDRL